MAAPDPRLLSVLLSALSLSPSEFSASSVLLHRLVAAYLSRAASAILRAEHGSEKGDDPDSSSASSPSGSLHLAALACFQRLADLPSQVPIDLSSLHDFIVVYAASSSSSSSSFGNTKELSALAKKIVNSLLRKKPSLARGIETQILSSYVNLMRDMGTLTGVQDIAASIKKAQIMLRSVQALFMTRGLETVRDILVRSSSTTAGSSEDGSFWTTLQTFYDVTLPNLVHTVVPSSISAFLNDETMENYIYLRHSLLEIFVSYFPTLSTESLLSLLEGEASSPEIPDSLADLPSVSLVNLSLLADAEYIHGVSETLVKNQQISMEERTYLEKSLRSTVPDDEDIQDGMDLIDGGKGKGKAKRRRVSRTEFGGNGPPSSDISLIQQVQAILPDTAPEIIQRLLDNSSFAALPSSEKVEKAVQMILEGHPEASLPSASGLTTTTTEQSLSTTAPNVPQSRNGGGKSAFAQARSNIFEDSIDLSRVLPRRGATQDIENDTFLPPELRKAILEAAERESSDDEDDDDDYYDGEGRGRGGGGGTGRTAAFVEDLGGSDTEARTGAGRVRVKDNVDEESDAEEEEARQHGAASGVSSRAQTRPATPSFSSQPSSGLSSQTETRFLSLYATNLTLFSREARKSPARADLRKETKLSDEQIEGWARMLERNPKKDKILAKANEFGGNEKGLEIRPGGGAKNAGRKPAASEYNGGHGGGGAGGTNAAGQDGKPGGAEGAGRGRGAGGPGRGRGRGGRGGQSEARRRGHDKKMAKQGGVIG